MRYREDFGGADWAWASLAAVGTYAGITLLALGVAESGLTDIDHLRELGLFLAIPTLAVMPLGPYLYGEFRGFEGSYFATMGGLVVGMLAGGALGMGAVAAGAEDASMIPVFSGLVLGPVVGYYLSLDKRPSSAPRSASLFDYNPTDGLRLSVPAMGFTRENNDSRFQVSLLSGAF